MLYRVGTRLAHPWQESAIQRFEQDNIVASRWEPSIEEYKETLKIAGMSKQQGLKQQMMDAAMFNVNTLVHHGSSIFLHCNRCFFCRWSDRICKLIQACSNKVKKLLSEYCEL